MIARRRAPMSPLVWLGLPLCAALAASVVLAAPVEAFGLQPPEPVFAMVPAFAWGIARPSVAPPLLISLMGLALDLLWGGPIGLWPLCLMVAYALSFLMRRVLAAEEFWGLLAWYAAACAAAMFTGVAMIGFRAGQLPSLIGVGEQFAITVLLFPFAWRLVERYESSDARYR